MDNNSSGGSQRRASFTPRTRQGGEDGAARGASQNAERTESPVQQRPAANKSSASEQPKGTNDAKKAQDVGSANPKASEQKKSDGDYSSYSSSHHSSSKRAVSRRRSPVAPILFLGIVMVLVAFVLPRLDMFSHEIEIDDASAESTDVSYLKYGDESPEVIKLQKAMYLLGALDFDAISGKYDEETMTALNELQRKLDIPESVDCSYECYAKIASTDASLFTSPSDVEAGEKEDKDEEGSENQDANTTAAAKPDETTSSKKTTTTTAGTNEQTKKLKVNKDDVRLRVEADGSSQSLYFVDKGGEYTILEEKTGADGKPWYYIRFKKDTVSCKGWIPADCGEVIYA